MSFNIKHVARLARLTLTAKEEKKYRKEIDGIVRYVNQLASINVSKEEATTRLINKTNCLRADLVEPWDQQELIATVNSAPRRLKKLISVPRIFES